MPLNNEFWSSVSLTFLLNTNQVIQRTGICIWLLTSLNWKLLFTPSFEPFANMCVMSPKIAISQSIHLIHQIVQILEGLKIKGKLFTFLNRIWNYFLASLQQLKHLHKLVKLLRKRIVCPGNASFSKLSCKESRYLTSRNLGDSGEIASGRNLNKLMESFWFLSFSVFILSKLFPLYTDGSVQHS